LFFTNLAYYLVTDFAKSSTLQVDTAEKDDHVSNIYFMMRDRLVEIQNLTISFSSGNEKIKAADDISFHIDQGEVIGLVGESGSGKSVTSLSIMRLLPVSSSSVGGKILFHEQGKVTDLLKLTPEAMRSYRGRKLGMIFQEPMSSLNPVLTCGDQVAEAIRLHRKTGHKEAWRQTEELFHQVQLPEPEQMLHRYPHQLSGGQKQRVMIAMAICCQPALLIADEPTTALDVTVQKAILKLLKELRQRLQISILFITHDLGVIAEMADRILVMYKGRLIEQGPARQILQSPQHPYTKGLLACRPPLNRRLKKLPVMADFMQERAGKVIARNMDIGTLLDSLEKQADPAGYLRPEIQDAAPLLQVRELVSRFPGKKGWLGKPRSWHYAVNGVSFDLYPGEMLGLVGESGCGKTTLSRAILQLIHPASGKVLYKGEDLCNMSPKRLRELRKQVQIIFQDPYSSLNPRLTIGAAIMEPMKVHNLYTNDRQRKHKAVELLEKVALGGNYFGRYPHEFSGGQRQRIGIARALAVEPDFIICDESVSALDVSIQAQVLNLLLQLREEYQFSAIFISHDLSVVKFMCDRVMVMKQGRIEETGTADEIYFNPRSEYTRRLIAAIPKGLA
jgi:peptide/nickel transport system ATP-binding protein